jgi:integrase
LWKKSSEEAKVEIMPLKNATRHSWGTQKALMGFSAEDLADGMGHSNARMTRNYIGAEVERQKKFYYCAKG